MRSVAGSSRGNGGVWTKGDFPQGHEPADALRNVSARQRRSRDVLDIRLEPKLVELLPPGELMPPRIAAHLATVAFPLSEHYRLLLCRVEREDDGIEPIRFREKG